MLVKDEMIRTLADTVLWVAEERYRKGKYKSLNSAIHAVSMEVSLRLMDVMKDNDRQTTNS